MDRLLALVHALAETAEGLTLDEMAERLGVNRRTAERTRDIIATHFDLDGRTDEDRRKRFFIRESLRRVYSRPSAAEIVALQAEVDAGGRRPRPHLTLPSAPERGGEARRCPPDPLPCQGPRELAEHLFTWGGELVIEGPEALWAVLRERLAEGGGVCSVRPELASGEHRGGGLAAG